MKKKLFFFSGSRADFDLIFPIYKIFNNNQKFKSRLIITGSNLDKKYSNNERVSSTKSIFKIKVNLKSSNSKNFSKIISNYFYKFYNFLYIKKPDLVIILGDRYETLIFAICVKFFNCKIIHLHGGESTKGSLDDIWRDMITKISDYHFTSLETYKKNVIKICGRRNTVFNLGSIGAYNVKNFKNFKIFKNKKFKKKILVSYHSSTTSISNSRNDFLELLKALSKFKEHLILFTYPGHDLDSDFIIKNLRRFKKLNKNSILIKRADKFNYSELLHNFDILVGNSSSGIIEAPSANIPTINIGDRQKGRVAGPSVFNVKGNNRSIFRIITKVLNNKKIVFKNPYYKKNTLTKICDKISYISNLNS
jgi:UDP-hydrolysing UDP-N-acetyl-D-glucosamine 2-epimerase